MSWREHSDNAKGWLFPEERDALYEYARYTTHPVAIEIGGYCGKSAIALAAAGKRVFSVDWHRGSPEMAPDRECHDPEMIGADGLFDSLPHFRRNIQAAGLEQTVIAVVGASTVAGLWLSVPCGLLFIDGAHDEVGVLADYELWAHNVVPGGYLIFHDATISWIGEVAERACREGFEFVEQVGCMRVLRRA